MSNRKILSTILIAALFILAAGISGTLAVPTSAQTHTCAGDRLARVRFGQKNEQVQNFQQCLLKLGHAIPAGATGYFGSQTRAAVVEFYQTVFNLKHEGNYIGPQGIGVIKKLTSAALATGTGMQRITSAEELRFYLSRGQAVAKTAGLDFEEGAMTLRSGSRPVPTPTSSSAAPSTDDSSSAAARVSETTVQVKGIDEPDIVKTDGQNIYFSKSRYYDDDPVPLPAVELESSIYPRPRYEPQTSVIKAFPPAELSISSTINAQGDLLLVKEKKVLAVFENRSVKGFDVADPKNPKQKWALDLDERTQVLSSRLTNNKIYVVTRQYLDYTDPCPIRIMSSSVSASPIVIPCIELYRPARIVPTDVTFTAFVFDPETGVVENKISFLGSSQDSVLYMSPSALYVTYFDPESIASMYLSGVLERGKDLFPQTLIGQFERLAGYELTEDAKLTEILTLLDRHLTTLGSDERLRVENEWSNRLSNYIKEHRREVEKTSLVKIGLTSFAITANGSVPGYPLNQFALDEFEGNLRVAVTIGERWLGGWGWSAAGESANDVYILDGDLKTIGSVRDLGLTERIYAVRFIGPRGYVVTFRQVDPFYVLDLSDPRNPVRKGELKIPGFSAYLEPIAENVILGVGQAGNSVKTSLFDVADPANPIEKSTYSLTDSWSETLSNHHAFLRDEKHQVFFIPGSQGGYIFSYKDTRLSLLKAVSGYFVKRAIFLDDYFYVISEDKIVVFNENNWEMVKELKF